jgi:hypothetical protein
MGRYCDVALIKSRKPPLVVRLRGVLTPDTVVPQSWVRTASSPALDHGQVLQAMKPGIARLHHGGASCPAGLLSRR